jgi:ribosomal-protein-alanine N-acetyltransferase
MNADPRVMEYSAAAPLSRTYSDAAAVRIRRHFDHHGFGKWVVELTESHEFVGVVGLAWLPFAAHFTPAVEVGWRLAAQHWGRGYATEAARAAIDFGFEQLKLAQIVACTVPTNTRSLAVMQRLGMTTAPEDDFDHPLLPEADPLRRHVLYRLRSKR